MNLQSTPIPGIGLVGFVHRRCNSTLSRNRKFGEWRQPADAHIADVDFPTYRLFWCSLPGCFDLRDIELYWGEKGGRLGEQLEERGDEGTPVIAVASTGHPG